MEAPPVCGTEPSRSLVCVADDCIAHPGHPTTGHCSSCLDEENQGYGDGLWSFRDDEPKCCCRDERERSSTDS